MVGSPHHSSGVYKDAARSLLISGTSFHMPNLDDKEPILDPITPTYQPTHKKITNNPFTNQNILSKIADTLPPSSSPRSDTS